ncbi:MAG: DUF3010 family protein [Aliidiomarina sp.]|uniref:DUF3010 family protein n=1 Tax=Aliidiomarina sp. TaxID=1872439 RepID=UPI0025B8A383|nr:DUF3010 family protein [Aliidiomarina sp.]MCH8500411.1 DUF3010 family protein [Aliidiomarina sp.]
MRVCGVEIKSNEAIFVLMDMDDGLVGLPDCRTVRLQLTKDNVQEQIQKFHFTLQKLMTDYKVQHIVIKERPQKGKFAGAAVGFKIETVLQLLDNVQTHILNGTEQKEILKRNPLAVDYADTGLKGFQQNAFMTAYAFVMKR